MQQEGQKVQQVQQRQYFSSKYMVNKAQQVQQDLARFVALLWYNVSAFSKEVHMARIADKHGLTNRYRPAGQKRVVKRGRPRKYLFGPPKRKTYKKQTTKKTVAAQPINMDYQNSRAYKIYERVLPLIVGTLLCSFIPIFRMFLPVVIGVFLLRTVEAVCKKAWNFPQEKSWRPLSWGWLALTSIEIVVCFFMIILYQADDLELNTILINTGIYIILSVLILASTRKKLLNK